MLGTKKEAEVAEVKEEVIEAVAEEGAKNIKIVDTKDFIKLNVRREPNFGAFIIDTIKDGEAVEIDEIKGNFAHLVNGGWVCVDFLK